MTNRSWMLLVASVLVMAAGFASTLAAQVNVNFNSSPESPGLNQSLGFNASNSITTYTILANYRPAQLNSVSGDLTHFGFQTALPTTINWSNVRITVGETTLTWDLNFTLAANFNAPGRTPVVCYEGPINVTTTVADEYWKIPLTTAYNYSGTHLLVVMFEITTTTTSGMLIRGTNQQTDVNTATSFMPITAGPNQTTGTSISYFRALGAAFTFIPPATGPSLYVQNVNTSTGLASSGSNTVIANVRNNGSTDFSSTQFTLEYSTDGGTNWLVSQNFTLPSFNSQTNQIVSFTTPWVVSGAGTKTLAVRVHPAIGTAPPSSSKSFVPDVDVVSVSGALYPAISVAQTVSITLKNNGQVGLDNVPIACRYTVDGTNFVTQTFTPTTFPVGGTANFSFSQPLTVTSASNTTLSGEIFPVVAGDPDATDVATKYLPLDGIHFVDVGVGTAGLGAASNSAIPLGIGSSQSFLASYSKDQLGGIEGQVREYGLRLGTPGGNITNLKIWMGETTRNAQTASSVIVDNFDAVSPVVVYDAAATITPNSDGYFRLVLSTPYNYTGKNNLLVQINLVTGGLSNPSVTSYASTDPASFRINSLSSKVQPGALEPGITQAASFAIQARFTGQHARVRSASVLGGGPAIGQNTVQAEIRNVGTDDLSTTPLTLEYSTNGGMTWQGSQAFTVPGLVSLASQTVSFTAPWTVSTLGNTTLVVRMPTPLGNGASSASQTYRVDADIVDVSSTPSVPVPGQPNTISVTLQNSGGFSLNGSPIEMRLTANGGAFVATQTFTPTTLSSQGATEAFSFTSPWIFPVAGPQAATVAIVTQPVGDPDIFGDSLTRTFPSAGVAFTPFGTGTSTALFGPPIVGPSTVTGSGVNSVTQMLYSASDLTGLPNNAPISSVAFFKTSAAKSLGVTGQRIKVWLRNTSSLTFAGDSSYGAFATGATLVYDNQDFRMPSDIGWVEFGPFNGAAPFVYTGDSLEVTVEWDSIGQVGPLTGLLEWRHDVINSNDNRGRGQLFTTTPQASQSVPRNGQFTGTRRPHIRVYHESGTGPFITNHAILPNASAGQTYGIQLVSVGGLGGPYTYALASGTLPPGITVSTTGLISGIPGLSSPSATPYTFTVSTTSGSTANKAFSISIPTMTVAFPNGALNDSQANHPYNCSLGVANGSSNYTITLTSGTLPPGLTLNVGTRSITGQSALSTVSPTPYAFTLEFGDGNITIVRNYTILVRDPQFEVLPNALEIASGGGVTGGNVLNTYWHDSRLEAIYHESELTAAGLRTDAWLLGLSLKIAQVPGRSLSNFRIRLRPTTDSSHSGTFATAGYANSYGPTTVTAASLTVGQWQYFHFATPYKYTGGNLMVDFTEDGTTFAAGGDIFMRDPGIQPRHLRGFGDSSQAWPFSTMNNGGRGTGVPALRFNVATPLVSAFTGFATAIEQLPYSQALNASGGTGSYVWTITAGQLPSGLTLNGIGSSVAPANVFGSPDTGTAATGSFPITLSLTDSLTVMSFNTSINVTLLTPVVFNPITLPTGVEFDPYVMTSPLTASNGTGSYVFSVSPTSPNALPNGLTLNGSTGIISGTPAAGTQGSRNIIFNVDDGYSSANRTLNLTINYRTLLWVTESLPQATATQAYSTQLVAIGGAGGRIYSVAPTSPAPLPAGLFLAGSTGNINGTPAFSAVGTHNILFRVSDPQGAFLEKSLTLEIIAPDPIVITTKELTYAEVGAAYSQQLAADGGTLNFSYTLDASSPALPAGFTLSSSGLISGTATLSQVGRYPIVVRLNDTLQTANKNFVLAIVAQSSEQVRITEVATTANYIEIMNTSTRHIDVSGWRIRTWIGGVSPLSFTFDTLPGASLLMRGEVVVFDIGGTAGGNWPTFATGTTWTANASSHIAVGLFDSYGTLVDFVDFGALNPDVFEDSPGVPANLPSFKTGSTNANGSANYSLGSQGYVGSGSGTKGVRNSGLASTPLSFLKGELRTARQGASYADTVVAFGGTPPYSYSIVAPSAAWLVMNASTGVATSSGTVPTGTPASVFADLSVTDALNATVTRTIEIQIASASATPLHRFRVTSTNGQTAAGTVIDLPITYERESGAGNITSFAVVMDIPSQTSAVAALQNVTAGTSIPANSSVFARRLTGGRVLVVGVPNAVPGSVIPVGQVAKARFVLTGQTPAALYPVSLVEPSVDAATGSKLSEAILGSLNIADFSPKDVNRDNVIDVVDVQLTVNIILASFTPVFPGQGDANEDNTVDVVDVQTIVNCILLGGC